MCFFNIKQIKTIQFAQILMESYSIDDIKKKITEFH